MSHARAPLPRLSKSRFLLGAQCHRLLWWSVHEPDAPELVADAGTALRFAQGHLVGEEARARFPGGVLIDLPHTDVEGRLARTAALLAGDAPALFEASFRADGVFVAVDVLVRCGEEWDLYEVKSTTRTKPEHVMDVAVQVRVLERAGVRVRRAFLMHLDSTCVHPHLDGLFAADDVTDESRALSATVSREARRQLRVLGGPLPDVEPGAHCDAPRACPFSARCHEALPAHHVSTLYRIGARADALLSRGVETVFEVDARERLSEVARRQVRAVQQRKVIVEDGLADALDALAGPVAFLDLETLGFAIPRYPGTRPYGAVPVQASVHLERGGTFTHRAFLAEPDAADPREALAAFLADTLRPARTILAWNAPFERRCLEELRDAFPAHRAGLSRALARLEDLLPVVRAHVYHPDFGGSFSLKHVAPALAPHLRYDDEAIRSGDDAQAALYRLWTEPLPAAARDALRAALLSYCALDTRALVEVWRALHALSHRRRAS